MISKVNKLLAVLLIVALALYVVLINNDEVIVRLMPGEGFRSNLGVVLLATFAIGLLLATFVALFFGLRSYFRERNLMAKERQRKAFFDSMLKAREYAASAEWEKAKEQWEFIVKRDPTSIIARVELSKTLQGLGQIKDALKVLDAARAADPKNIEVLFRAAEVNRDLNNKTAALDNLALIVQQQPNSRAALFARTLCEELGRYDDALEYHNLLSGMDDDAAHDKGTLARLQFKKISKDMDLRSKEGVDRLREFVKKHPDFVPAISTLAQVEAQQGRMQESADLYLKATKVSGSSQYWNDAARLWLKNDMPDRAIAATKAAVHEAKGDAKVRAEIDLARLYIGLNMLEDAQKTLERVPQTAKDQGVILDKATFSHMLILDGLCLSRMGQHQKCAEIWKKLSSDDLAFPASEAFAPHIGGPSPRLSTP